MLETTFGERDQTKEIKVRYLVIDSLYSYNMIIGRLTLNHLGAMLFTLYLCIKYPLSDGRVGVIQ